MTAAGEEERFRLDPTRGALQLVAVLCLVLGGFHLWTVTTGRTAGAPPVLWLLTGLQPAACGAAYWLATRRYGVRVGPTGLTVERPFGLSQTVAWDAVAGVRRRQVGVSSQLVLDGPPIPVVLSLHLSDPAGFADAVAGHAGPDHPLTEALRERQAGG